MTSKYTSLLHISDLHLRAKNDPNFDLSLGADRLVDVICERLSHWHFQPSCIVASGDFTNTCQYEEFKEADRFLKSLYKALNLKRTDLVLVPGNHDVDWPEQVNSRTSGFAAYENFFKTYRHDLEEQGDNSWFTCDWHDDHIFVLGLNSCLIEARETAGVGYVDVKQLEFAALKYADRWAKCATRVAVIHHHLVPVAYNSYQPKCVPNTSIVLNTEQVITWLLENQFDLVLHGHKHVPFFAGEKRYLRDRDRAGPEEGELIVIGAGSAGASLTDIGELKQRSFNMLEVGEFEVAVRTVTYGDGRPDLYRNGTIPFPKRPQSPTISKLLRILQKQYTDLARTATTSGGPGAPMLFTVDVQHLLTLAPAIYAIAGNRVLATSFVPIAVDFWTSKIGELFLEATAQGDKISVRRLFVAPVRNAQLLRLMNTQARARVHPRYLSLRAYSEITKQVLTEVRQLLANVGVPAKLLEASEYAGPEHLALAVYGDPGRDALLGFDLTSAAGSMVGLVFEPPQHIVQLVSNALEGAWKRASTLPDVYGHDDRPCVFLLGVHRWNRSYVIRECLEAGLRVVIATLESDKASLGMDLLAMAHDSEVIPNDLKKYPLLARHGKTGTPYVDEQIFSIGLDDYVTAYAAAIPMDSESRCFPQAAANTVSRKHELRKLWNDLAGENSTRLHRVDWCYLAFSEDGIVESANQNWLESLGNDSLVIVKPDELSASIEIHGANGAEGSVRVARDVSTNLIKRWSTAGEAYGINIRPRVIVEAAIPRSMNLHDGAEFSAEVVSFDHRHIWIGVTQKWTGTHYIETAHLFPSESFPDDLLPSLRNVVFSLLDKLEVRYCVSHWEFIVTPEHKIALVEGHLRPAGDHIMELVEKSTGHSPTGLLCRAMAGGVIHADMFKVDQSSAIFWLVPVTPLERVDEIRVDAAETSHPGIRLMLDKDKICSTRNWSHASDWTQRPAAVLATGNGMDTLRQRCRAIASSITISMNAEAGHATRSSKLKLAIDP